MNTQNRTLTFIQSVGILPVITLDDPSKAPRLGEVLLQGGLPAAEITFRTPGAAEGIQRLRQSADLLLGAGTVLTTAQAESAAKAGADFMVSPGLNEEVVQRGLDLGLTVIPGVATPTDVEKALALGLTTVKFFPAAGMGGIPYLKALAGPYPSLKFIPTGGINPQNLQSYLSYDKTAACGGSWLAPRDLINQERWEEILLRVSQAVSLVLGKEPLTMTVPPREDPLVEKSRLFARTWGIPLLEDSRLSQGVLLLRSSQPQRLIDYWKRQNIFLDPLTGMVDDEKLPFRMKLEGFLEGESPL